MKALLWITAALIQITWIRFNSLDHLHKISDFCFSAAARFLERAPSRWTWLYEGVLIGRHDQLRSQEGVQTLIVLGLYHLFVVSGGHVLALEKSVEGMAFFTPPKTRRVLLGTVLLLFALVNRLQPACVRAVLQWFLDGRLDQNRASRPDLHLVAACLCLILQPDWVHSLSFQITCAAILGLGVASALPFTNGIARRLAASFFCTLATAPLIFCIQPCLSWLIVPANTFLLPVFDGVLFPLSVINVAFHGVARFTEPVFSWIFGFSGFISKFENPFLCFDERNMKNWGMLYVAGVFLAWRYCWPWISRRRFWRSQRRFAPAITGGWFSGT